MHILYQIQTDQSCLLAVCTYGSGTPISEYIVRTIVNAFRDLCDLQV